MTPPIIYLHINSFGGSVFAAFAAIDFIKQSPLPVFALARCSAHELAHLSCLIAVVAAAMQLMGGAVAPRLSGTTRSTRRAAQLLLFFWRGKVHTIVEGAVASAGTLMSVCGARRYIRPHASMLIHELSSWFGGKMTRIEDEIDNLHQMMDEIKAIYSAHTGLEADELNELLKHDLWWKSDKCLEKGLVDAVWDDAAEAGSPRAVPASPKL